MRDLCVRAASSVMLQSCRSLKERPVYHAAWKQVGYRFADLKELMGKATPPRAGDVLAGVAARSAEENVAAKMALADVPLKRFLTETLIAYESCEVTRLIIDRHNAAAFAPVAHMTGSWPALPRGSRRKWRQPRRRSCAIRT
jgi:hypothetical protein